MANKTKNTGNIIAIAGVIVILLIGYTINKSMDDLKTGSSLREEKNILLDETSTTQSDTKEELANYWDQELLIAQQVENAINYKTSANAISILKNIEDNLDYNKNKVAVVFYLGDAYAALGEKKKASEFYMLARNKFKNGNVHLYILNTPRLAGTYKDYSVSVYEESYLRQAKLEGSTELLRPAQDSPGIFGVYKNEKFLYSYLANRNISRLRHDQPFVESYEQYWRLAYAENTLNSFISQYLAGQDVSTLAQADLLAKSDILKKFKEQDPSGKQFKFSDSRTSGSIYFYTFTSEDGRITIELLDDHKDILVSNIAVYEQPLSESSGEGT